PCFTDCIITFLCLLSNTTIPFDFAFRGFKFLETEGSNFCGEGSCTNTSPAYGTTPIKRKRHLTVSNIAKCLYFCGFPDILFLPFVSIKRVLFPSVLPWNSRRCLWKGSRKASQPSSVIPSSYRKGMVILMSLYLEETGR
ncbi:MAG: hypothetical protein K2N73_07335, partial [Lachnospiraceae bacterium]|nr:hypothetical protein [Lachnospiraceae bacterium]